MNVHPDSTGLSRRHLPRRRLLAAALALPLVAVGVQAQGPSKVMVEVWKDPQCGCCKDWATYLEANGFAVRVHDKGNAAMRARMGIAENLGSCHTALVGGYAIEGHVPAREIRRLLQERPDAIGLTVPGMPVGSPGMDGALYGGRRDPHDVLLVRRDGRTTVYASYFKT